MSEIVVGKAGGTSNATAEAVAVSLEWAEKTKAFVVSAPGKHPDGRDKITKRLIAAHGQYLNGGVDRDTKHEIIERYEEIVAGLGVGALLGSWVDGIGHRIEQAVRYGEDETSMLGEQLQAEVYEACGLTRLDPSTSRIDLASDPSAWRSWLSQIDLRTGKPYVIPGNITKINGKVSTFSTGGSDTTSGYVAYGLSADLNLNLTDGPAQSADPAMEMFRDDPNRLRQISHLLYVEGRELGRNGTGLVHPAAMVPLMIGGIPTEVRSTFDSSMPITLLDNDTVRAGERKGRAVALSMMENVSILTVNEPGMADALGRLAEIEGHLAQSGVTLIDSQGYGVDAQRYFVKGAESDKAEEVVSQILKNGGKVGRMNNVSLITIVGYQLGSRLIDTLVSGLVMNSGIDPKKWQSEGHEMTPGEHSLRISVPDKEALAVFDRLHSHCIEH